MEKITKEMIAEEYPGIFLWQKPRFIAYHKDIDGISKETLEKRYSPAP